MSDKIKPESVYERARDELDSAECDCETCETWSRHEVTLSALTAGEAAEKRAEEAEAQIAAMHEGVFAVVGPDGKPYAVAPSQASGFYRAIRKKWDSEEVARWSREFRETRRRAEEAERERDELRARVYELEATTVSQPHDPPKEGITPRALGPGRFRGAGLTGST